MVFCSLAVSALLRRETLWAGFLAATLLATGFLTGFTDFTAIAIFVFFDPAGDLAATFLRALFVQPSQIHGDELEKIDLSNCLMSSQLPRARARSISRLSNSNTHDTPSSPAQATPQS